MKNFGYQYEAPKPEDYTFGGGQIVSPIVNPSGQWDEWLPLEEPQAKVSETQACVSFATLSILEILAKKKFWADENWSDRWLAWNSDTDPFRGNSPQKVAETLRRGGVPKEEEWSYPDSVITPQEYYETPPTKLIQTARTFLDTYTFKHDYIEPSRIKEALTYSPVGMSVFAWYLQGDVHVKPQGMSDNHWCVCYGYDDEKRAWKVFDSYDNFTKLYTYDAVIQQAKRYNIEKRVVNNNNWLWNLLHRYRALTG